MTSFKALFIWPFPCMTHAYHMLFVYLLPMPNPPRALTKAREEQ